MRVREKWRRLLCVVMGLLLCMSWLPFTANAEETETGTNEIKDYVLLLDCSGTMRDYDPYRLCAAACKQFLDQVPLENTRISIIAFGFVGDENYKPYEPYQMNDVKNPELLKYVHLVTPLQETSDVTTTKDIKNVIDDVTNKAGGITPIGISTLAAIDHLEKNGATDGNAAIILISDGEITTNNSTTSYDVANVDIAVDRANAHNWKMFTIQMNDKGAFGEKSTESVRMRTIAERTGVGHFGYVEVRDFSKGSLDINVAIAQIITYMSGNEQVPEAIPITLPAEEPLTIEEMVSECNITVLGSNIRTITLTYPDNSSRVITGNVDEARLITSWEENSRNIKLIVPQAGDYKVKVEGDNTGEAAAILFRYSVMDPTLEMVSNPVMTSDMTLSKQDRIAFEAHFTYHEIDILNSAYYEKHPAELRIISSTGSPRAIPMDATPNGYQYTLPMDEAGEGGAYSAQIWIADNNFTGGGKYSNIIHFKTQNLLPDIIDPDFPSLQGYIGQHFETVDLSKHLDNPDNDPLEYRFSCTSDRNVTFDYTIVNDYMTIPCGMVPGVYQMEFAFRDPEMTEFLVFNTFTLTVAERPIESFAIPDVELWVDYISLFQEPGDEFIQINLLDYFTDPDNQPLVFSPVTDESGFVNVNKEESILTITPALKGETVLTFTVNDSFNTVDGQIKVIVISGKSILWEKVKDILIAAVVLLIIILLCIFYRSKKKGLRGEWDVTVSIGDRTYNAVYPITLSKYRKTKKQEDRSLSRIFASEITPALRDLTEEDKTIIDNFEKNGAFKGLVFNGTTKPVGFAVKLVNQGDFQEVRADSGTVLLGKSRYVGSKLYTLVKVGGQSVTIVLERHREND